MHLRTFARSSTASLAVALMMGAPLPAMAQERMDYHLPAQPLADTLRAIAIKSGRSIVAPADLLNGKPALTIDGAFSLDEVLAAALAGTGLRARHVGTGIVVERIGDHGDADGAPGAEDIVVTGSRIRGAASASTVITQSAAEMRASGKSDLGSVVRALPQSFGGGQNPGLGANVPTTSGANVGNGSSINLRGLGSDATLTLINGHRLAYDASRQSIDVSAIPLVALDRIEIVPDGSSALYGSDAIAGVANIILKRDYRGLETGAEIAGTTDGGGFTQQYDALAGTTWSSGGVMIAYEFADNAAITSEQRTLTRPSASGLTLFPAMHHHSAVLSGHQSLTDHLTFSLDALFNSRKTLQQLPANAAGNSAVSAQRTSAFDRSFDVAPSLKLDLGTWEASLSATYGKERVDIGNVFCQAASCAPFAGGYYRNIERSLKWGADGPLIALPAGDAKLAVGAGYRSIGFLVDQGSGNPVNVTHGQNSYYGFGELNVPLIGSAQALGWLQQLDLSAAVRYERYPGVGAIATPRFGLIAAPSNDLSLKATWGRSFRAPTVYEEYQPRGVYLYPPRSLGATGLPASATALLVDGGNPGLKPERARTWSATLDLHPRALAGARVQLSYFEIAYRDRIVVPITYLSQALSSPIYAPQVTRNPDPATQAALLASTSYYQNLTGADYDPANVVAIVNNSAVNAGRQNVHGVDILADDRLPLGRGGTLHLAADAAYLVSTQQLSPAQPVTKLAGTLFNPPHWRAHATLAWLYGGFTLTGDAYHYGGVDDVRSTPAARVKGMTTVDLTGSYLSSAQQGPLTGVRLTASVQNLFNTAPAAIAITGGYFLPYDSTNYSPIGRRLMLGVSKKW